MCSSIWVGCTAQYSRYPPRSRNFSSPAFHAATISAAGIPSWSAIDTNKTGQSGIPCGSGRAQSFSRPFSTDSMAKWKAFNSTFQGEFNAPQPSNNPGRRLAAIGVPAPHLGHERTRRRVQRAPGLRGEAQHALPRIRRDQGRTTQGEGNRRAGEAEVGGERADGGFRHLIPVRPAPSLPPTDTRHRAR